MSSSSLVSSSQSVSSVRPLSEKKQLSRNESHVPVRLWLAFPFVVILIVEGFVYMRGFVG
jgi:hypothetical protein